MSPGTDRFLKRSAAAVTRARGLLDAGSPGAAASRAYYAMLYAAQALLNERGLRLRTHTAVCNALRKHYVEAGCLDARFYAILDAAVRRRTDRDEEEPTFEDAERTIEEAGEFLAATRACLGLG